MILDTITPTLLPESEPSLHTSTSPQPSPTTSEPQPPEKPSPIPLDQRPVGVYLDQFPAMPTAWLWPQRLPLGKLTLLDAAPGCGASLLALTIAAHVSSGTPWPDGTPCRQGTVLLITPYDGLLDTLIPRLQAAGADLSHVILHTYNLDRTCPINNHLSACTFPRDLRLLETTIKRHQADLVLIDPASAIAGLPKALPDLAYLAFRTNCALLLTRSLDKPPADPLHAHAPASPILTAARSHLLLAPDPSDERTHLLLTPKHSLCVAPAILSYYITTTDQDIPTIHWLGERTTSELTRLGTGPLHSPQRQAILHFLHNSLTPHPIKAILAATSYDYEAGRKMLLRMKQAGELISPAPGLYTTPNHPCLAHYTTNHPPAPSTIHEVNPSEQPEEPVPVVPCPEVCPAPTTELRTEPQEPVPAVPCPQSHPQTSPVSTPPHHPPLAHGTHALSPTPETPIISHADTHTHDVPPDPNTSPPALKGTTDEPPPTVPAVSTVPDHEITAHTNLLSSIDVPPVPSLDSDSHTHEFPSAIIPPSPPRFEWNPLLVKLTQPFPTDDSTDNIPIPHLVEAS